VIRPPDPPPLLRTDTRRAAVSQQFRVLSDGRWFELLISPPILDEIARVLAYPKIARRHRWSAKVIRAFVQDLGELAVVTLGQVQLSVIHEDPDDDRYLECAVEGEAEYIVSGDRHLLALRAYRGTAIVSPRAFLAVLPAARPQ
jgi:hypothetical protein